MKKIVVKILLIMSSREFVSWPTFVHVLFYLGRHSVVASQRHTQAWHSYCSVSTHEWIHVDAHIC